MIKLRDFKESDINDYINWFTKDTEWMNWDAPWQEVVTSEEKEKERWSKYLEKVKQLKDDDLRNRFEIDYDGIHVGCVNAYKDTAYFPNPDNHFAIGAGIIPQQYRSKGIAYEALNQFMDYLMQKGETCFYTQTWSGNIPMLALAKKLGFEEVMRLKDYRYINGKYYDAITLKKEIN